MSKRKWCRCDYSGNERFVVRFGKQKLVVLRTSRFWPLKGDGDVIVKCDKEEFLCHEDIIGKHSGFFQKACLSGEEIDDYGVEFFRLIEAINEREVGKSNYEERTRLTAQAKTYVLAGKLDMPSMQYSIYDSVKWELRRDSVFAKDILGALKIIGDFEPPDTGICRSLLDGFRHPEFHLPSAKDQLKSLITSHPNLGLAIITMLSKENDRLVWENCEYEEELLLRPPLERHRKQINQSENGKSGNVKDGKSEKSKDEESGKA